MSHSKLVLLAGATLGVGSAAFAQSANTDQAYAAELMADAEGRTSLMSAASGHDGKFFLSDPSGNFRLNVGGQLQFRYMANFRDDGGTFPSGGGTDATTLGFQTARTRLVFDGQINGEWGYKVQLDADRGDGSIGLLDAYATYGFEEGWTMGFGQAKLPILREESTASKYQLAMDRSNMNAFFTQGYSQGVWVHNRQDEWEWYAAFSDGIRTGNTDILSAAEADYALTGRVNWKWAGDWKQFKDFTSPQGSEYAGQLGAAVHWQSGGSTAPETDPNSEVFLVTVDAQAEFDGWNLYGAFVWAQNKPTTTRFNDMGAVVQGGVYVTETDELFARWDAIFADSDRGWPDDSVNALTFGWNHYFIPNSHAAKFTADLLWSLNKTEDTGGLATGGTGTGLLGDDDSGEISVRAQFQLLF